MPLTFTDEQATTLLEALGLKADDPAAADPSEVLAVVEDLAKQEGNPGGVGKDAKPSDVAAAAKRHGLETIDADTLAGLRDDAAEGRRIKAAATRKAVEDTVDAAITTGKIAPSRRDHWIALITADSGMGQVLASVPDGTVASFDEVGHNVSPEGTVTEPDDWFR